jgi:hypothetical protein
MNPQPLFVGVDPGKMGAVAVMDEAGGVTHVSSFILTDFYPNWSWGFSHFTLGLYEALAENDFFVGIEEFLCRYPTAAHIKGSAMSYGMLLAGLRDLHPERIFEVRAREWQAYHDFPRGKTDRKVRKQQSLDLVYEYWPDVEIGTDDNKAEAILIADYVRETYNDE